LLVHPNWRRHGIGGTLVKMCQSRFSGCYLYADPAEENKDELKEFYLKLGFKEREVFRKIST
ncbi:GNAT family N-acetyltransferase, partial [Deltaproteobacteria bacterium TL4]